jgi:DUF2934 family protein
MTVTYIIAGVVIVPGIAALMTIAHRAGRKKAEPSERGEILKQLLALSEREPATSAVPARVAKTPQLAFAHGATIATATPPKRQEHYSKRKPFPAGSKAPLSLRAKDTDVEEQIRRRAYELYQQRGEVPGRATDDWLQAKDEVLRAKSKVGKASPEMR